MKEAGKGRKEEKSREHRLGSDELRNVVRESSSRASGESVRLEGKSVVSRLIKSHKEKRKTWTGSVPLSPKELLEEQRSKERKVRRKEVKSSLFILNQCIDGFYKAKESPSRKHLSLAAALKEVATVHIPRVVHNYRNSSFLHFRLAPFFREVSSMMHTVYENMGNISRVRDQSHFGCLLVELFKMLHTVVLFYKRSWSTILRKENAGQEEIEGEFKVCLSFLKKHLVANLSFLAKVEKKQRREERKREERKEQEKESFSPPNIEKVVVPAFFNTCQLPGTPRPRHAPLEAELEKIPPKKRSSEARVRRVLRDTHSKPLSISLQAKILTWCAKQLQMALSSQTGPREASPRLFEATDELRKVSDHISLLFLTEFAISQFLLLFLSSQKHLFEIVKHSSYRKRTLLRDAGASLIKSVITLLQIHGSPSDLQHTTTSIMSLYKEILNVINYK